MNEATIDPLRCPLAKVQIIAAFNKPIYFTGGIVLPGLEMLALYSDEQPNIDLDISKC